MHTTRIYNEDFYNANFDPRDETMGVAFVAPLIAAAPGIFQSVMGIFGGGRKAQFQGLAEIQNAGNQAVQSLQQILAGLQSGQMAPGQAVSEAQRIVQQFNDPAVVYPAKKGKDAEARNQYISQLNALLQQIQAKAASMPSGGGAAGGLSGGTLILLGGGILAVMMLKK
jgi:hypothetical protein